MISYKHIQLLKSILMLLAFISIGAVYAQDCGEKELENAKQNYEIGKFQELNQSLEGCIASGSFKEEIKVEAYRLLALSDIALDSVENAKLHVTDLLRLAPYYQERFEDPTTFKRLIQEAKTGASSLQVTSVSKTPESLFEAPATIMVVTSDEIKQRGYKDIEEIFHDLPGFDISRTSGGTYSSIYQRGFRTGNNNDRSLMLVDGIEDNDIWSNAIWMSRQYPLSFIKQLEVIHGPASTMYGANAFVGVYNVVTKNPDDLIPYGSNFGFSGSFGYASYNTRFADMTMGFRNRGLSGVVTTRIYKSDEFDRSSYADFDYDYKTASLEDYKAVEMQYDSSVVFNPYVSVDSSNVVRYNNKGAVYARHLDSLGYFERTPEGAVGYSNATNDAFVLAKLMYKNFTLGYQFWSRDEGLAWFTDNVFGGTANGSRWTPTQSTIYLKYDKELNGKISLTNLTLFKDHRLGEHTGLAIRPGSYLAGNYDYTDLNNDVAPSWRYLSYYLESKQYRNETKLLWNPNKKLNVITGLELRYSIIQENYVSDKESLDDAIFHNTIDLGLYSQGSYRINDDLKAVLGGRLDYNKIDQDGGYGFQFNPRAVMVWSPLGFIVKGIYSEAFKDATNFDKYSVVAGVRDVPNPTLPPEKVRNMELSVAREGALNIITPIKTYAELNGFYTVYSGLISTVINEDGDLQNANVGALDIVGSQFIGSINYKDKVSLQGNYTYTHPMNIPVDSVGNLDESNKIRVGDIATHKFNLILNYKITKTINWNTRLNVSGKRLTGNQTTVASNPLSEVDGFQVLNTALSWTNKYGLSFAFVINNVTDAEWFVPGARAADGVQFASQVPQSGRNFQVTIRYDLR